MTKDLLGYLSQYTNISIEEFAELINWTEHHQFNKRTILTKPGDVEDHMYFITKGLVRKYFLKGKDEIITHLAKEGTIIGSGESFLTGAPSKYFVETLEPTIAFSISREKLEEMYASSKKWEKLGRIMTTQYFVIQEMRVMDNIRYSTRERFMRFMKENTDLLQRVPQKYLASYLNIKPETFSRLKHLMVDK
ncbi:MAG TPA: Crp/Fnr family transcriptional regulator [Chitinophagaceae bacterium]|nr:Crp/Fnr family transcriptional regulator [Chitinophagaceae bacterium]